MKKLKLIGFLCALFVMATSLTSCLSNNDNGQSGQGLIIAYYTGSAYGSPSFTTYDGTTTIIPTTTSSLNIPTNISSGDLCYIIYTPAAAPQQSKADTGAKMEYIDIQKCWSLEYKKTESMDLEAFKADTAAITPDSLKQQASILGMQSYATNNEPYTIIKDKYNTGSYKLLSTINYYLAVNPTSSSYINDIQGSNRFYFYYDENDWTDNNTLVLRMARFTKYTKPQNNLQGYSSFSIGGPVSYFSYDVSNAVNAFKEKKGNLPSNVKVANVYIGNSGFSEWAVTNEMKGTDQESVKLNLE